MWIDLRGKQHRVYYRNPLPENARNRDYLAFYGEDDARKFIALDADAATAIIARALAAQAPIPGLPRSGSAAATGGGVAGAATPAPPTDPREVGVTFSELWSRFLAKQRHIDEGTVELYEGYGKHHLLPFFGSTDIGLIIRTRPLRAADAPAGALYVDDDWVTQMLAKERLNNVGRPVAGSLHSLKFVRNVLAVLGQCLDLAVTERPALLEVNAARDIRLPKHDRREMHFLEDAAAYAALRGAMHDHFRPVLDFLVGTGARYGEAAGLLVRHLHLDAERPFVDIRLALKWRGKKWKLGRPKTRSSVRRILLPSRLVETLRPLTVGKGADDHVFTMLEGGPLHHGNFYNRYWKEAVTAAGTGVPKRTRIHDLRHTHAAWLLSAGVAPMVVAARLGHSSATTTQNVYGHVTAEADDRAIDVVDDRLPDVLAVDDEGATVLKLTTAEERLPEFDIDDEDDAAV
jgi:integrase